MRTTLGSLILTVPICFWVACSSSPRVTVTKTDVDTGSTVALSRGDTLAVVLKANPTTGYGWVVAAMDTTVLREIGSEYVPDTVPKGIVGSGGRSFLRFAAVERGKTAVKLEYRRSWETTKPPAKTFQLEVSIEQ
jgi:inhibitor of cysteine peptidase